MNILVTGANSMIGINAIHYFLSRGDSVTALIRKTSDIWRLGEVVKQIRIISESLSNSNFWDKYFASEPIDWIIHLATVGSFTSQKNDLEIYDCNLRDSLQFIQSATLSKSLLGLISTGSSAEYGFHAQMMSEVDFAKPMSSYGISKLAFGNLLMSNRNHYNFKVYHFRLYNIYGPFDHPTRLIPRLISHAVNRSLPKLSNPNHVRDYVYVDDLIRLFGLICNNTSDYQSGIYNVASGVGSSLREVVEIVCGYFNLEIDIFWDDSLSRNFDSAFLVGNPNACFKNFDWGSSTSVQKGVKNFAEWYRLSDLRKSYEKRMFLDKS
jgi:nucleoside-diphosphate-sugar epimerase